MEALRTVLKEPMDVAEPKVREALYSAGFGVLSEIDVAATLKAKLGVERPGLRILGACNPHLAHRALEIDPSVSLLLPCNVVLEETDAGTQVSIADPTGLLTGDELRELAEEASGRLQQVIEQLG